MINIMKNCTLCPRQCRVDRTYGSGFCGGGDTVRVAKIMTHPWEEPCICGEGGAGAVFFSGCALGCVYCQNRDISRGECGEEYTADALSELFTRIANSGVSCLDLVTPSHYAPQIDVALAGANIPVPVVYNVGGYERADTVRRYMSRADVFLADFKYGTAETAAKYSSAPDYTETAVSALRAMYDTVGDPVYGDDGILQKGVILRHLVLPGERRDSVKALQLAASAVPPENVILSLMRQYTPGFAPREFKNLCRRVTTFEYDYVRDAAIEMGYSGYSQDKDSATAAYTPDFRK
ncbi:MAG: 4Fe-4S cluster-binding domain-containing protein [Clostridia bacterium]|nr:4Fe-4S cluster-binding domain-containing protein [Clostridia bacterium]